MFQHTWYGHGSGATDMVCGSAMRYVACTHRGLVRHSAQRALLQALLHALAYTYFVRRRCWAARVVAESNPCI